MDIFAHIFIEIEYKSVWNRETRVIEVALLLIGLG